MRGLIFGDRPDDLRVLSIRNRFEHVDRVDIRSIGEKKPPSGELSPKYDDTFQPVTLGTAPRLASETQWVRMGTVGVGRGGLFLIVRKPEHNGGTSTPLFSTNVHWNSYCARRIPRRMNRSVRGFDHAIGEREREHSVYARTILMFSPTRGCADTVWTLVVRVYSKTSILDHGGISLEVNDPDSMTHGCGKN